MIQIRPYLPADLPTLHRIDKLCFPRDVAYTRQELRSFIEDSTSLTLVAEEPPIWPPMKIGDSTIQPNRIGGFIIAQLESRRKRTLHHTRNLVIGHIITIDVLPEYRQRKLGTTLLNEAEEWLRQSGAETVSLETATTNEPAISFYQKHGYALVQLIKKYYADGADAFLMAKQLKA